MLPGMKKWMRFAAACLAALLLAACGRSVVVQPNGRSAPSRAVKIVRPTTGSYRVVRGDTLYSIAFRNGLDFRDLAAWNGIDSPYTIWPGQVLRLSRGRSPAASTRSPVKATPRASSRSTPVFKPVAPVPSQGVVVAGAATVAKSAAPAVTPVSPPPKGATHTAGGVTWRWPADGALIKKFQSGDAIPGIELAGKAGDPVRAAAGGVVVYSGNGLVGYGELIIIKHNDDFLSAYGHNRKRLVKEGQRVSAGQLIAEMGSTGAPRNELQFQIRRNGNPVDPLDYLPAR